MWDDLFDRAPHAPVYKSRAWSESWLAGRGSGSGLVAYGVLKEARLVALLPLVRWTRLGLAVPVGTGEPAYLGLLLDDDEPGALAEIADLVTRHERCFCTFDLSSSDRATRAFLDHIDAAGWRVWQQRRNIVFQVDLPDTYQAYLSVHKSPRSRQRIRRRARMVEESFRTGVERFAGASINEEVVARCVAVEKESWMVRRRVDVLSGTAKRSMILGMADEGLAEIWILTLDGQDAAFAICYRAHGVVHYEHSSFSLGYPERLSIGSYLLDRLLQDVIDRGDRVLDFGHGDAEYKRFWGTSEHSVDRVAAGHGLVGRAAVTVSAVVWALARSKRLRGLYRKTRRRLESTAIEQSGP